MATPTDPLFTQQWHFPLIGNIGAVWDEYTGSGISVGVYDDGLQYNHPDLAANYDATKHFTHLGITYDAMPIAGGDHHGTACGGIIGSVANNGLGGVGVASGVTLTGVNYLDDIQKRNSQSLIDAALRWATNFDIMSNSWGETPNFAASQSLARDATVSGSTRINNSFEHVTSVGRDGLGTIIVKAAGNDSLNANGDGVNASRFTITIAATESDGYIADYSNYGVNILVAAPAAAVTTDRTGNDGENTATDGDPLPVDYSSTFSGTSAATPVVAGVVALMLEANSGLGWRDVKSILAASASHTGTAYNAFATGAERSNWKSLPVSNWNGGGTVYNHSYGYGMVDAFAAVRMAEVWSLMHGPAAQSSNEQIVTANYTGPAVSIPDCYIDFNTFTIVNGVRSIGLNVVQDIEIETVYVTVDLTHQRGNDLALSLVLPTGQEVEIMTNEDVAQFQTQSGFRWTFGVEVLRGLSSQGNWQMIARDGLVGSTGYIQSVKLEFFGSQDTANDVYTYTDDFLALRILQPARALLNDTNGGLDWINMAAIATGVVSSLSSGGLTTVNGVNWFNLAGGGDKFENLVTGDGNDVLTGNSLNNHLMGMRGRDALNGATGNDTLDGGAGVDDLNGGDGNDTYFVDHLADLIFETSTVASGTDTVKSSITWALGANLEKLVLTGGAAINGTGNALANELLGNARANILKGGAGADKMTGGLGNDTYEVDNSADVTIEGSATGGIDLVKSSISRTLGANIENLTLTGAAAINGTGNSLSNVLLGNAGANTLAGGEGKDALTGGAGIDRLTGFSGIAAKGATEIDKLTGGTQADRFVLGNTVMAFYGDALAANAGRGGYALITDFTVGEDKLQLKGSAADYYLGASGVAGMVGKGLFYEQGATDELIAIVRSGNATTLTDANTIQTAVFV